MSTELTPEDARRILWFKGNIRYKLDKNQNELYDLYLNSNEKIIVWACARQLGKSYTLCTIAIETCLKTPNVVVKFLAPTQKMVKTIIKPTMRQLLEDCPLELRPEYKTADGMYVFPNGSEIHVCGSDGGRAESIRGGKAVLLLVDEGGFINDLDYIVKSILIPTTTMTNGKIILASTPPKSPGHAFVTFFQDAKFNGCAVQKTIYENPRLTQQNIDQFAKSVGGYNTIDFKREYLAQILIDDNFAIVPEFTPERKVNIIQEWKRPPHYDAYVSMDIGLKDLTVALFAYFDFKRNKLIIEDEYCINGQKFNTKTLAQGIKDKEDSLFIDPVSLELKPTYMRVCDNNLIVINDLWILHGIRFIPTKKDDAESALNDLRVKIGEEKIIINPRCVTLIRHLEEGVWNKSKTSYERSTHNFHYDAIDALKYLVRNVQWGKNPYPAGYGVHYGDDYFKFKSEHSARNESINKMLNLKNKTTNQPHPALAYLNSQKKK